MTYNTFSSSPTHTRAQSLALASLIADSGCAFIALQEISAPFYRFLLAQPSFRESGYAISRPEEYWRISGRGSAQRGKEGAREACVVLVKEGLLGRGSEVRVGRLGRGRDEGGKAAIGVRILRLATSHFSSLHFNAHLRTRQFRTCLSFLSHHFRSSSSIASSSETREDAAQPVCILLGDFNASNASEFDTLTSDSSLDLVDAFDLFSRSYPPSHSHPKKSKKRNRSQRDQEEYREGEQDGDSFRTPPTFGHLYPWIRPPSTLKTRTPKPRKVRRIDRVYLSREDVQVRGYEHRGGQPLEGETDGCGKDGGMFASDHEAVVVEVEVRLGVKW
ncbi:Endonuclease/exonuclease/phosphatase [Rhodotorula toruloides]|nr:Endonuclease/exonuclease/phosphatase [Rhodotorula toruloides]